MSVFPLVIFMSIFGGVYPLSRETIWAWLKYFPLCISKEITMISIATSKSLSALLMTHQIRFCRYHPKWPWRGLGRAADLCASLAQWRKEWEALAPRPLIQRRRISLPKKRSQGSRRPNQACAEGKLMIKLCPFVWRDVCKNAMGVREPENQWPSHQLTCLHTPRGSAICSSDIESEWPAKRTVILCAEGQWLQLDFLKRKDTPCIVIKAVALIRRVLWWPF